MNTLGTVVATLCVITILNFIFKKLNIFTDQKNISKHKSFISEDKGTPLSGGLVFFLILVFFLPGDFNSFKILIFFIFLAGLFSDLNILHSPNFRILFQSIIILAYLLLFDNFINSVRVDFLDNLLNIFFIKLIFTSFCILVLINGTNFMDGVNTLVAGYYILIFSNLFYLAETKDLYLDNSLITVCFFSLIVVYIFNFFGRTLLGDSGSYLISFVVGVTLIKFSNDNYLVSPYYIAAILWYPAYENLFSIIRKRLLKKSPSRPDNEHLHQFIFLYLNKSLNIGKNLSNSLSGLLICIYNLFYFFIIFENFNHTEILVYSILTNVLVYNFLYFLLRKKLISQQAR